MNLKPLVAPSRTLTTLLRAAVLAGGLFAGQSAQADSLPNDLKSSVAIEIAGRVSPHCVLGDLSNFNFGDLGAGGSVGESNVALNCNVPFDLTIRSANGGFVNPEAPNGQGPYQGLLPYQVQIDVPVRTPHRRVVSGSYSSRQLQSGSVLSSGDGVAFDGARIRVQLNRPIGAGLLAGRYNETIEMSVSPRT